MNDTTAAATTGDTGTTATTTTTTAKPWYDGKVDAEIIGHWDNKGWKKDDPAAVAIEASKAARELQKHFGVPADQLLKLPKDATDEAGWKAVRERLGAPKEAKEYDFSSIKFVDGSDLDPSFVDPLRAVLHKAGVPKDAAPEVLKTVVKYLGDAETSESAARTARLQTERAELDREWGSNKDFNRLTAMQGAKRAVGSDEAAAKMVDAMEAAIGYKATMEFFRKIGAGTSEDTFADFSKGASPVTMNGAKARLEELRGDPEYVARYLKGMPKEVQEMNSLILLASGVAA